MRIPRFVALAHISLFLLRASLGPVMSHQLEKTTAESDHEAARIERLAGLCELWGAAKYFHPYLSYKSIDWDKALVDTIPLVNAARSPAGYERALAHLLSILNDPQTRLIRDSRSAQTSSGGKAQPKGAPNRSRDKLEYVRFLDRVMIVSVAGLSVANMQGDQTTQYAIAQQTRAEAEKATGVVLDCRGNGPGIPEDAYLAPFFLRKPLNLVISSVIDRGVALATKRSMFYSGYTPQDGTTSGGYFAGLMTTAAETLSAWQPPGNGKHLTFLIDEKTPDISDVLAGLQSARMASVVSVGDWAQPLPGYKVQLPDGITASIRTTEEVLPDGSTGFRPDLELAEDDSSVGGSSSETAESDAPLAAAIRMLTTPAGVKPAVAEPPAFPRVMIENPWTMKTPSTEYRLLGLFRFWNVINYFFAYRDLLDEPWENVLKRFIPRFEAANDATGYSTAVSELAACTNDSHGFVNSEALNAYLGVYSPPLEVREVEGSSVVTGIANENVAKESGIALGDQILEVDGELASARIARIAKIMPASTPQSRLNKAYHYLLAGAQGSEARIKVKSDGGGVREVLLKRDTIPWLIADSIPRSLPVYTVLPAGFGYIDLTRLTWNEVDKAFEALAKTPAIILDVRGYPKFTFQAVGAILASKTVPGALFYKPQLNAASPSTSTEFSAQMLSPNPNLHYSGKVVVLINEQALSQSEHTCLFIEAATKAVFVGTPTSGVDGDVTNTILPGGISISFSGQAIRHGDGRQLQRIGILPDVKAAPTIKGIRERRDEVLDAAVKFLSASGGS
ncbi:MAG TPA: S41 family peptidase [Blastocatellia bacterium]|nr:S41 family peptidase [Blastocatellia bacterium]